MKQHDNFGIKIDWLLVVLYALVALLGWLNIYAAVYDETANVAIWAQDTNSGKQLLWIGISVVVIVLILIMDYSIFTIFPYFFYAIAIILLIATILFAREVNGARAWLEFGPLKFQASEVAKLATALTLAKFINDYNVKFNTLKTYAISFGIMVLPIALIALQPDPGTILVFMSFLIAFYREGMDPTLIIMGLIAGLFFILTLVVSKVLLITSVAVIGLLIIGLLTHTYRKALLVFMSMLMISGFVISVDKIMTDVLKPHHQNRIRVLLDDKIDPLGVGWNIKQSKIAIGSGGLYGKGFLEGTQTKYDFVPEQSTDFIFCTIAEEHGWIGSFFLVVLYMAMLLRIIYISERQKYRFTRVYGYFVAGILFFHFMINMGMTIGLFPVIGIPLPFFSYGGSSLLSFSVLLFVLIKLDAHRNQIVTR
ncbi:rod shape-determining protein RodA [Cesiribacter andamanensis]|uniref:Cell wall polymerase n=1 Tax=Cesiribacter andamanensis AMV16 TaxID=1279009 RepID=M7N6V0_9BACT|nr:rod shape-determining protein RodA [Cesiribacter andamanensis]EMR02961.1 Rod shape-determining protein RodA [Cesiribacter andamanensis AMV16]